MEHIFWRWDLCGPGSEKNRQNEPLIQEISNGRTHVSRTPKKPDYLKALSRNLLGPGSVGIRSHSVFDGTEPKPLLVGFRIGIPI